ncbi:MAG: response regulator, partial [Anaerolineales bacterium]|nr:response regulator [Anaerolineales bacterium]
DGTAVDVELSASGLRDANSEVIGSVIILRDVSERKHAEQAKAQLEEQLRQAQKLESIGRLAGGIAHDFNNLLIPIIGFTDLVQYQLPEESPSRKHLTKIRTAADKATGLTRQILAFSRQQVLEMEVVDLCQVITEFKDILQRLIGENIRLHFNLPNESCLLNADRTQIEQVLLNLGVNARDAMPAGGDMIIETGHVYLDADYVQAHPDASEGPHIRLTVSDSGVGMDADTIDHIFEPFFTTKEKGKGTGLGLATVFGIVKQHKGSIWVGSEPGKGTSFNIYLPYPVGTPTSSTRKTLELATVTGTETILVVEDELMVRRLICEALATYGYDVIEAADGQEALELMALVDRPVQLLLTDLIMPGINGRQLYEQLAQTYPTLKVLYISGYTDDVIGQHGVLENDVNFLHKPFSIYRLAQEIRSVLNELCVQGS